jgi:hypothetical protein
VSAKIAKANAQLDSLRQKSRRYKALWTLYTVFAYILLLIVLFFVVGRANWRSSEYIGLLVGPVIIYTVRLGLVTFYEWRISTVEARLKESEAEREGAIKKLKDATRYDSTQQLLEKYGGSPKGAKTPKKGDSPIQKKKDENTPKRTGLAPPMTANIPRHRPQQSLPANLPPLSENTLLPSEDFAPNAFSDSEPVRAPVGPSQSMAVEPRQRQWYDRILDVILGEDETSSQTRLALICSNCRQVNGLAPPGAKTLSEVGQWRCSTCHAMNGESTEVQDVIAQAQKEAQKEAQEKAQKEVQKEALVDNSSK